MTKQEIEARLIALRTTSITGLLLKNTHRGSDWYGNCEACGKRCDTHYTRSVPNLCGGHSTVKFGHLDCLKHGVWESAVIQG